MMKNVRLILGTMPFGGALHEAQSHKLIKDWVNLGYSEIDTAIMYQDGKTEKVMGKLHLCREPKVKIACKANPSKGFTSVGVIAQVNESLQNLNISSCDILYLHLPDHSIPIEETLQGVNKLHKEGKFNEFGLSNYASWEVADVYHICKQNGYVLPTVYQGMYNALTRDIELELIPACRKFGLRFYVYNPLAGGILTGKYDFSAAVESQPSGRFFAKSGFTSNWTKTYRDRYWRDSFKAGTEHVKSVLLEVYGNEMSLLQASMSWLRNHSKLTDNDGIILGISKEEHFQVNIDACKTLALDERVVEAFEEAWNNIKSDSPQYYR